MTTHTDFAASHRATNAAIRQYAAARGNAWACLVAGVPSMAASAWLGLVTANAGQTLLFVLAMLGFFLAVYLLVNAALDARDAGAEYRRARDVECTVRLALRAPDGLHRAA